LIKRNWWDWCTTRKSASTATSWHAG
jgi:hypothetical protein